MILFVDHFQKAVDLILFAVLNITVQKDETLYQRIQHVAFRAEEKSPPVVQLRRQVFTVRKAEDAEPAVFTPHGDIYCTAVQQQDRRSRVPDVPDCRRLVRDFREAAGDHPAALEVFYARYEPDQIAELKALAEEHGLYYSVGSDNHGREGQDFIELDSVDILPLNDRMIWTLLRNPEDEQPLVL